VRFVSAIALAVWLAGLTAPHVHAALHHETATACCSHAEEHSHESCLHRQTDTVFQHQCPVSVKAVLRLLGQAAFALVRLEEAGPEVFSTGVWNDGFLLTALIPRAPPV